MPLPVIPVAGYLSHRLTTPVTPRCSPIRVYLSYPLRGSGCGWVYVGPMTMERVRDGEGESATATQIIANIPLKGREGSLWAPDKPALVKRWERERWQVQCSSGLAERNRKWQGLLHMGPLGCSDWLGEHVTVSETASCNALNAHMAPSNNRRSLLTCSRSVTTWLTLCRLKPSEEWDKLARQVGSGQKNKKDRLLFLEEWLMKIYQLTGKHSPRCSRPPIFS